MIRLGDLNAKILNEIEDLNNIIGKHIFKQEGFNIEDQSDMVQDNRERLVDFCTDQNCCIINNE